MPLLYRLSELIETRRQQHLQQMQAREDEMRQMFVNKVKDKEAELKHSEQEVSSNVTYLKYFMIRRSHFCAYESLTAKCTGSQCLKPDKWTLSRILLENCQFCWSLKASHRDILLRWMADWQWLISLPPY